jgi:NDP-sugar pyrophosphorylase family protein
MLPVLNKPLLTYIIGHMVEGVPDLNRVVIAANYRARDIREFFEKTDVGVEVVVQEEKKPLGTGGAVGYSRHLLDHDDFFMLNGDVITILDYHSMFDQHRESGAVATISAIKADDLTRYGVMVVNEQNMVSEFYEKPKTPELLRKYAGCPVNAGTYLLQPAIFDYIPDERPISIENEIFPQIVAKDGVFAFNYSGYWRDFGNPIDFMDGSFDLLDIETNNAAVDNFLEGDLQLGEGTTITAPCCVGSGVKIGANCDIGPHAVIGRDCEIADYTVIRNSVLFEGCLIGQGTLIDNAILADGIRTGHDVRIQGEGITRVSIGTGVNVEAGVALVVEQGAPIKICPYRNIDAKSLEPGLSVGMFLM